ncbi:hypothetical protein [Actinomadura verrucosospora]|uniref:Uncharacterized protein n=1 Tax=Actinomadura verrucosospora TaxID=46165 RepID=A0A7D3VYD5_ACTVE|nr:hypothetical protein [Actinomadura verrucosospora]QKG24014.1 hypothetical protein ACTIVE_5657 [Actinomadura verrucosospora]
MYSEAVGALYAAFTDVPRPARVHGCPCCVADGEDRPLLARPPRDLAAGDLARYAAKALNTWGDEDDLRYFAPRLLELAADDAFAYPDPEIVFGKLARAGWERWPQRDAVAAFLDAFWTRSLAAHPGPLRIRTALCALGCASADVSPQLTEWSRLPSGAAIRHLHDFATEDLAWKRGRLVPRIACQGRPYEQVVAWLSEGAAARAVGDAFERADDEDTLAVLTRIDSALRGLS